MNVNPGELSNLVAAVPAPGIKYNPKPLRPSSADLVVLMTATLICIGPRNMRRMSGAVRSALARRNKDSKGPKTPSAGN